MTPSLAARSQSAPHAAARGRGRAWLVLVLGIACLWTAARSTSEPVLVVPAATLHEAAPAATLCAHLLAELAARRDAATIRSGSRRP